MCKIYWILVAALLFIQCEKVVESEPDPRLYNDAFHGNIVGIVLQKDSGAKVYINQEVPIDSTEIVPLDGTFRFENQEIGNYDLTIKADAYRTYRHSNVKVEGAGTTYLGEIDLSTTPDLVSYFYPDDNSEIVYNNRFSGLTISVSFTQPMDRESVEEAFETDPPTEGIFTWGQYTRAPSTYYFGYEMDGNISHFDPGATITTFSRVSSFIYRIAQKDCFVDTVYNVTLSTAAHDTAGNQLRFPLNFSFSTVQSSSTINGIQTNPAHGDVDVGLNTYSGIQITFPRNMDQASTEAAISMTPEMDVVYIWPDYNKLTIYTGGSFMADTTYVVNIDSTAADLDGLIMRHPFSFSFQTESVGINRTYPRNGQLFVDPNDHIVMYFNTYMVKSTVVSAFSIEPVVSGSLDWDSRYNNLAIRFDPYGTLKSNTKYTVTINTEAEDLFGTKMKEPYSFSFITRPE